MVCCHQSKVQADIPTACTPVGTGSSLSTRTAALSRCPFVDLDGSTVYKEFGCLIGIGSLRPWPHYHAKVKRKGAKFHQYVHKEGTYEPMWVEFICRTDHVIDRSNQDTKKRQNAYSARKDVAMSLVSTVHDYTQDIRVAPEKRIKKRPASAGPSAATLSPWRIARLEGASQDPSASSQI